MKAKVAPRHYKEAFLRIACHAVLATGCAVMVFPFYWMLVTSLKGQSEAQMLPPTLWPSNPQWANFVEVFKAVPMARYLLNSFGIATVVTAATIATSTMAAHAFAMIRFPGRDLVFGVFLATMMIPFEVILIPDFILIHRLGWYNTYAALIVPWCSSVFAIFLLRQSFLSIPSELHEASMLDGCSHLRYMWNVAVPLSLPSIITVGIVSFLGSWNSLLWPLVVTDTPELRPVQVGLAYFTTEAGTKYHLAAAAATVSILPIVILYLAAQRHFVEGIARTGLKT
ncbi:MAG: carbohydrate ABC transporter permease [Armatimonadota bacterium]